MSHLRKRDEEEASTKDLQLLQEKMHLKTQSHLLLPSWRAWGVLSPQEVQEYSAKACSDFQSMNVEPPSDLAFYSTMGTRGQYKHLGLECIESFHDIMRMFCRTQWLSQ